MLGKPITGRVVRGLGRGAQFTVLPWVAQSLHAEFGIAPFPGTLNVVLNSNHALAEWAQARQRPAASLTDPDGVACAAQCYPVRINAWLPGVVVRPLVEGYPDTQLEIVAAVGLRETAELTDGDEVGIEFGHPTELSAVIFDVDGTLLNSVDAYHIAAGQAAAPHGFSVSRDQIMAALTSGQPFWEMILPEHQRHDESLIRNLRDATLEHWPDVLSRHVTLFARCEETLDHLRLAGLRLAIYTGSRGESFAPLQDAGLLDRFECIVTAKDVTAGKPDPEGIDRVLGHLGLDPNAAAYVGDSPQDMQAANAAGVMGVGVLTGVGTAANLSTAGASRLARGLSDLEKLFTIKQ